MKRRILALLLALTVIFALAAGCGSNGEAEASDTGGGSDTAESAGPSQAVSGAGPSDTADESGDSGVGDGWIARYPGQLPLTEETYTLTLYGTFSPELYQAADDPSLTEGMLELQSRTNVAVEYLIGSFTDSPVQFNVIVASGDYPDILPDVAMNYAGGLSKAYEDGVILDMTQIVADYMPCYSYYLEGGDELKLASINDEGQMLEAAQFQVSRQVVLGPFVRQDWLEEAGMSSEDLVTYDDYYNALTALKVGGHSNALMVGVTGTPEFNYLSAGYGVAADLSLYGKQQPFMNVDGAVKYGPLADGYLDYIWMMAKWYGEGLVYADFISQQYPSTTFDGAASGKLGIVYAYTAFIEIFEGLTDDPNFHMVGIRDAVQKEGDKLHLRRDSDAYEQRGKCISTTCKNVEVVAKWIDYQYSYDGYILANYGIEGITYYASNIELDIDPQCTELALSNPDGLSLQQVQFIYCSNGGMLAANLDDAQLWDEEIIQATELWAESDNAYCLPTAMAMTAAESEEFASLYGDIETYVTEWQCGAIMGSVSLDSYGDMVSRIEQMGIGRCIEIYQDALERCLSRLG